MIRKKWTDGEPMLSVETEDESHKALPLGLPIEVSPEIAEGIGLMARTWAPWKRLSQRRTTLLRSGER